MKIMLSVLLTTAITAVVTAEDQSLPETSGVIVRSNDEVQDKRILKKRYSDWDPLIIGTHHLHDYSYSLPLVFKSVHLPHTIPDWKPLSSSGWYPSDWYPTWPLLVKSKKYYSHGWKW